MYSLSWKEANINGKVRIDFSRTLAFTHTATKDFIGTYGRLFLIICSRPVGGDYARD